MSDTRYPIIYSTTKDFLKITFSAFIASILGEATIICSSRGSTTIVTIGSGSYSSYNIAKSATDIASVYVHKVYYKDNTANNPIYIEKTGGGPSVRCLIIANGVSVSVTGADSVPSGYTEA